METKTEKEVINPFDGNVDFDESKMPKVNVNKGEEIPEDGIIKDKTIKNNKYDDGYDNIHNDGDEDFYDDGYDDGYDNDYGYEKEETAEDRKIKKQRAKKLAEVCVNMYAKLKELLYSGMVVDEMRIEKWFRKGKVTYETLNYPIELANGKTITVLEYIDNYYNRYLADSLSINEDGKCELDDYFKKSVIKSLTEIFYQRNIGTGEESSLIINILTDLVETATGIISNKYMLNQLIKSINKNLDIKNESIVSDINKQNINTTNNINTNNNIEKEIEKQEKNNVNNENEIIYKESDTNKGELVPIKNTKNTKPNNKKAKGRGRPKGSKNKSKIKKVEIPPVFI